VEGVGARRVGAARHARARAGPPSASTTLSPAVKCAAWGVGRAPMAPQSRQPPPSSPPSPLTLNGALLENVFIGISPFSSSSGTLVRVAWWERGRREGGRRARRRGAAAPPPPLFRPDLGPRPSRRARGEAPTRSGPGRRAPRHAPGRAAVPQPSLSPSPRTCLTACARTATVRGRVATTCVHVFGRMVSGGGAGEGCRGWEPKCAAGGAAYRTGRSAKGRGHRDAATGGRGGAGGCDGGSPAVDGRTHYRTQAGATPPLPPQPRSERD